MSTRHAASLGSLLALLALVTAPLAAQTLPPMLPAPANAPPEQAELAQIDQAAAQHAPQAQATREQLLARLEELRPGSTRPENLQGGSPFGAPQVGPPEHAEREQVENGAPAALNRPVTINELINSIRALPRGQQMIQEARQRGAQGLGQGNNQGASADRGLRAWLASLNPFRARPLMAANKAPSVSVTLTPSYRFSSSPYAGVWMYGAYHSTGATYELLYPGSWSSLSHARTGPFAYIVVHAPADGWYIVNYNGYQGNARADLRAWNGSSYAPLASWDYSGQYNVKDFPALVQLGTGYHYFFFRVDSGWARFDQINFYSL